MSSHVGTFSQLFRTASLIVSYAPMRDEPDPQSILEFAQLKSRIVVLNQDPSADPVKTARELRGTIIENDVVVLLIPGRAFDATGTRHGRGGGWYDRFLHDLPKNWLRIGVASRESFTEHPLKRESWDEPMDWLIMKDGDAWRMQPCTNHRRDQL